MRPYPKASWILGALICGGGVACYLEWPERSDMRRALEAAGDFPVLELQHPIAGAVMPRKMPAPVVSRQTNGGGEEWLVEFKPGGERWWFEGKAPLWRLEERVWRQIKEAAPEGSVEVIVRAFGKGGGRLMARGATHFTLSRETVLYSDGAYPL